MDRRDFVRLVGGGIIASPLAGCAGGKDIDWAWRNPGAGETDPRRRAIAWGILAPNPHNMQPWLLDLRTPGEALVYLDPERLLPQTDPFNRQIIVGTGAFLELMRMAAARDGVEVVCTPFPEGEPEPRMDRRPVAHLAFRPAPSVTDPLYPAVLKRRTNRSVFEARPVAAEVAKHIADAGTSDGVAGDATVDPVRLARLRDLANESAVIEAHTPAAHKESNDRTFFGDADVAAHPYGVSVRGPLYGALNAIGLLNHETIEKPGSFAYNQLLDFLRKDAESAQGFVWLTTPGNSRAEQLEAGRAYLRANLQATALGVAMQPFSQGLQEYPTMAGMLTTLHRELAPAGGRVQMFVRIGYGPDAPPSPKRGVDAQLLKT
jgi:hypothetical protein